MNAETRAKELASAMARHIIGENFAAGDETCAECVAMVLKALRQAENDKLEEAARLMDRVMADSKAALIRTLKHED